MDLYVALLSFPVIFLGELPDKTMFASLLLATRGRPRHVWVGAAGAFALHVAIATTIGVAIVSLLPRRVVDAAIAVCFLAAAGYAWWLGGRADEEELSREPARRNVTATAFAVIFIAEWGDLTQILTANLAARYHHPLSVAIGALLALWSVAAIAVFGGQTLVRFVNVSTVRKVTAVVLVALAGFSAWSAAQ